MNRVLGGLILALFVQVLHAPSVEAGLLSTTKKCAQSVATLAKNIWESPQPPTVRLKSNFFIEAVHYGMGPFSLIMRLMGRKMNGAGRKEALVETFRHDRKYVFGYIALVHLASALHWGYYVIPFDDFDKKSQAHMNQKPEQVLVIQSMPENDMLYRFGPYLFQKNYASMGKSEYVSVKNFDELLEVLKKIPSDKKFDRIEIFMHGYKSRMATANRRIIDDDMLQKLKEAGLSLGSNGADVRFIVCSLVKGTPFKRDDSKFEIEFARAVAPDAKQLIASSRDVVAGHILSSSWNHTDIPWVWKILKHAYGLGVFVELWPHALLSNWRNFGEAGEGVIVIDMNKASE